MYYNVYGYMDCIHAIYENKMVCFVVLHNNNNRTYYYINNTH